MYIEDYMPKARFVGEIIGQLSMKMDLPKKFVEMYEQEFGEIYESLPQQIIHRDPNPGNIILCGDKWGILDFDLSEKNVRIFDPCYAATAILSESFEDGNTDKLNQWIMI